ncbi:hypothetical protein G210_4725 [Candida maltosa Xu316]|uniref:Uncharacterized protein n=1 Tax=Candida maltosa (strain Xu316) TaxID=1245528 RepID=M3K743_CANMX|nr:hypothetical protein G210_4725 [Candida maltosa Xu316]
MSPLDFEDDLLILTSPQPPQLGSFTNPNSQPRIQRRTSNFFPSSNDNNSTLSTPNIQVSTETFQFPNLSSINDAVFGAPTKTTFSEPPLSPFYTKPVSISTSTISSPVLNNHSQTNFTSSIDYHLTSSLSNLHLQSNFPSENHPPSIQGFMITSEFQSQNLSSIWNKELNLGEINFNELPTSATKKGNRFSHQVNNPVFVPTGTTINDTVQEEEEEEEETVEVVEPETLQLEEEESKTPRIRFPSKVPYTPDSNYFVQDMVKYDLTNRYNEGYSTTFYKRNKHGYMFIREATNTLHVHQNSWVQLKIKLPVNQKKLLIKKLKVDIKELPIWKPKA